MPWSNLWSNRAINRNKELTMEADPTKAYNQDAAAGFIRLNALRLKVAPKSKRKNKYENL